MKLLQSQTPLPHYRPNAGLCIINAHKQVLACERADIPGAWQCPQGGIDAGETPEEAAWRELFEETGITHTQAQLTQTHPDWLSYDFITPKEYYGQSQKWFLFQYNGPLPKAENQTEPEFNAYAWQSPAWLLQNVVTFRKNIYVSVFQEFGLI